MGVTGRGGQTDRPRRKVEDIAVPLEGLEAGGELREERIFPRAADTSPFHATAMLREMDMRFWLEQAEAELKQLG